MQKSMIYTLKHDSYSKKFASYAGMIYKRGRSTRLFLPSLNWAAHLATVINFGAWLAFAKNSSSAMVYAETFKVFHILNLHEFKKLKSLNLNSFFFI